MEPPDEEKVSYALGMNLALEIKRTGADVDVNTIVQALKDVMAGKTTRISDPELRPIFQKALAYERAVLSKKNKTEGEAYLAKNAKTAGVTVLPDGLQYRVIKAGTGPMPKPDDNVTINSKGHFIDGREIDHKEKFEIAVAGQMKGFQEALQLMQPGAKWEITLPPALAFGSDWNGEVGPDSTLVFELELVSITPSVHSNEKIRSGPYGARPIRAKEQDPQTNAVSTPPGAGK
jgi:FKBP-type peptidyl-prolyl cis-trans isomerase FklB